MHILNSFVVQQDSILQTGLCVSQSSRTPTPVTSLGHQEGRRVFREGPKFFKPCPIFLKLCPTFFQGAENFCWGGFAPPGYRPAHTSAPLLVFDKILAQPHRAVVNCSDAVMSVFHSPDLTRSLIFLQL